MIPYLKRKRQSNSEADEKINTSAIDQADDPTSGDWDESCLAQKHWPDP